MIYYLTKDWTREMGGLLVDCETGERFALGKKREGHRRATAAAALKKKAKK